MTLKPLAPPIFPPAPAPEGVETRAKATVGDAAPASATPAAEPRRRPRLADLARRFARELVTVGLPCGALGFAAGLRTTAPLVALAGHEPGEGGLSAGLQRVLAGVVSAGELVATKIPFLPRRASPTSVLFHLVAGAAAGAYGANELSGSVPVGAAAGAVAAAAGFAVSLGVRAATLGRIPGAAVSLAQDAAALALARFGAKEIVLARA